MKVFFLVCVIIAFAGCSQDKNEAKKYFDKGRSDYLNNNLPSAAENFKKAYECDDSLLSAKIMELKSYYFLNRFDDALNISNNLLKENPYYDVALFWRAKISLASGKSEKSLIDAESDLRMALELNYDYINARILLAKIFFIRREYREAIFEYKKALEIEGDLLEVHKSLSEIYSDLGMLDYSQKERIMAGIDKETEESKNKEKRLYK